MEPTNITVLVVGGAIGLGFKIIFDWLRNRNGNGAAKVAESIQRISEKIDWMKEVHAKTDESGRPMCYFPSRVMQQVEDIDDVSKSILIHIKNLLQEIKSMNAALLDLLRKK